MKRGSTSVSVASATTVVRAEPAPSGLKTAIRYFTAPISSESPTMPLSVIITAAKTVSRASAEVSPLPPIISVTISATSITVTATASSSDPNGSPTRCATTSAWWTADSTAPIRKMPIATAATVPGWRPHASASTTIAATGASVVQLSQGDLVVLMPEPYGSAGLTRVG